MQPIQSQCECTQSNVIVAQNADIKRKLHCGLAAGLRSQPHLRTIAQGNNYPNDISLPFPLPAPLRSTPPRCVSANVDAIMVGLTRQLRILRDIGRGTSLFNSAALPERELL